MSLGDGDFPKVLVRISNLSVTPSFSPKASNFPRGLGQRNDGVASLSSLSSRVTPIGVKVTVK
jgi:hypothetical protein